MTLAFVSALLSAAAAITQKKILFRIDAVTFSFLVSAIIMVLSFGVPFIVDITAVSVAVLAILVVKSIINAFAFVLVMMMLERADISGTLPLLALTPGVTAVLAFVAIGESISPLEILGLFLMIGGVFLLERKGMSERIPSASGKIYLIHTQWRIWAALLLFAISAVMDKVLVSGYKTSPLVVLFYQHAVFLAVYAVMFFQKHVSYHGLFGRKQFPVLALIFLVALLTLGYRYTQLAAVKVGPVALVLAVKRTSVFFATLVGGKIFSEKRLIARIAGAAVIIAAGFLILRNVG